MGPRPRTRRGRRGDTRPRLASDIEDVDETAFSAHHDTPASVVFDARGRVVEQTERDGSTTYTTTITRDIRGNPTVVNDPAGRDAAVRVFDFADRKLREESIDAGDSIVVHDAGGTPVETRDAKGGMGLKNVDKLGRPAEAWGRDTDASDEKVRLVEDTIHGDEAGLSSPKDDNLLGVPYERYDEAGKETLARYDFKGNLLERNRQVIDPQHMIDTYNDADSSNNWEVDTYRVDWTRGSGETWGDRESELLKNRDYRVDRAYDALDRTREVTYPADKNGNRALLDPTYNKAGNLQAVDLDGSTYVEHIAYNPRGQRILAALGNGVMTRYAYDPTSFRLERMRSEAYTKPDATTYADVDSSIPFQDFHYTYDGVGNVVEIYNEAGSDAETQKNVGVGGSNSITRDFEYDPLYRLTKATGREFDEKASKPWNYLPGGSNPSGDPNDPNQTRHYTETYNYDAVGSLTKLTHDYGGGSGTWTRDYVQEAGSNRLDTMDSAGTTYDYTWDAAGNLLRENTTRKHEWDWGGRMRSWRNQVSGSQATVFAHYTYESGGQRVQKVVSKDNAKPVHSVYIGGLFEHHERYDSGSVVAENNFLHVMDDDQRVAVERIGSELDGSNPPSTQYHLGDHLQSSNVVVDGSGTFYNREEYRPYGESSFGSHRNKRYRFTGQHRDEESSLSYHGARYYLPWTARWSAPDPKGMVDGPNVYSYVKGNPLNGRDPKGMQTLGFENVDTNKLIQRLRISGQPTKAFRKVLKESHVVKGDSADPVQVPTRDWFIDGYRPSDASRVELPSGMMRELTSGSTDDFTPRRMGALAEELTHSYITLANEGYAGYSKRIKSEFQSAEDYFQSKNLPMTSGQRTAHEAAAGYVRKKVRAQETASQLLSRALSVDSPSRARTLATRAIRAYRSLTERAPSGGYFVHEATGDQVPFRKSRLPGLRLPESFQRALDKHILQNKIPDKFKENETLMKRLRRIESKYGINIDINKSKARKASAPPSDSSSQPERLPGEYDSER